MPNGGTVIHEQFHCFQGATFSGNVEGRKATELDRNDDPLTAGLMRLLQGEKYVDVLPLDALWRR